MFGLDTRRRIKVVEQSVQAGLVEVTRRADEVQEFPYLLLVDAVFVYGGRQLRDSWLYIDPALLCRGFRGWRLMSV